MKLKIKIIFGVVMLIVSVATYADKCSGLQGQVNHADWKLRQGGNSSYMKYWRQARDGADKRLSQCRRSFGTGEPQIKVYAGRGNEATSNDDLVSSDINDPQLQQLIKTCNFWINEYNRNASPENLSFRDNACRDVKTATDRLTNPQKPFVMLHKRSAKECIKPNNVIDNEVRACIEGVRQPTWLEKEQKSQPHRTR